MRSVAWLALSVLGCRPGASDDTGPPTIPDPEADTDTDSDADTDADTDTDADSDSDSDADADSDTDTGSASVCPDDPQEPNDTLGTALDATEGVDRVVCAGAPDFWRVDVAPYETLHVTADFVYANGDIDLYLWDEAGIERTFSFSGTDHEALSYQIGGQPESLLVEVRLRTGSDNTYTWGSSTTACNTGVDEPNDTLDDATPLSGTLVDRTYLAGEVDLYRVEVGADELLTVVVSEEHVGGDLDLTLAAEDGLVLAFATSVAPTETVRWVNDTGSPTPVFVQVEQWVGSAGNCFEYDITSTLEPHVCPIDPWEDNDLLALATPVPGAVTEATATLHDDDFFEDVAPPGRFTSWEVLADPAIEVELELFDGNGDRLERGNPSAVFNDGTTDLVVVPAVTLASGICGDYTLVRSDATPTCAPDAHEPDDTPGTAGTAVDGSWVLDPGDPDHFVVPVAPGHRAVVVGTVPLEAYGEIELELLDEQRTRLDRDASGPIFDVQADNPGSSLATYVLAVDEPDGPGACVPYDLVFYDLDCAADDAWEPNDTLSAAAVLDAGNDLFLNDADEDWFAVGTVPPGQVVEVVASFVDAHGDIDLELVDATGALLDSSGSNTDDEAVRWTNPAPVAREVRLRVHHFSAPGCSTPYAFRTTIGPL
ncbi:MAG: hypothetical protein R3F61_04385 [Myxococcota bacterium]